MLGFNQSQWLKPYVEFNTEKLSAVKKNGDEDGKALCKLMSTAVYGKTMENVRYIIGVTLKQQKVLFKMDIKIKLYVA